jgi:hypothetical protein
MLKQIFALKRITLQHVSVLHQIEYLNENLCEYFEAIDANKWCM